jgi:hypothetical protein
MQIRAWVGRIKVEGRIHRARRMQIRAWVGRIKVEGRIRRARRMLPDPG